MPEHHVSPSTTIVQSGQDLPVSVAISDIAGFFLAWRVLDPLSRYRDICRSLHHVYCLECNGDGTGKVSLASCQAVSPPLSSHCLMSPLAGICLPPVPSYLKAKLLMVLSSAVPISHSTLGSASPTAFKSILIKCNVGSIPLTGRNSFFLTGSLSLDS